MAKDWPEVLMIAPWPEPQATEGWEDKAVANFGLVQDIVRSIRNLRAEKNVKPSTRIPATFSAGDDSKIVESQVSVLASLGRLDGDNITITKTLDEKPAGQVALVVGSVEIFLPLADMVDTAEERARLGKELAEAQSQIERLQKLLNSPFAEKAPDNVVQAERDKLAVFKESAIKLKEQIDSIH